VKGKIAAGKTPFWAFFDAGLNQKAKFSAVWFLLISGQNSHEGEKP
jgi:hypothetical protein